jgi:hypothetical protein
MMYYSGICLKQLRKNMKNLVTTLASVSISSDRDQLFLTGPNIKELSSLTPVDGNGPKFRKAVLEKGMEYGRRTE